MRVIDPCGGGDPSGGDPGGSGGSGYYICGCNPSHLGGNENPDCICTMPDIWISTLLPLEGDVGGDYLRSSDPCEPL